MQNTTQGFYLSTQLQSGSLNTTFNGWQGTFPPHTSNASLSFRSRNLPRGRRARRPRLRALRHTRLPEWHGTRLRQRALPHVPQRIDREHELRALGIRDFWHGC